MRHIRPLARVLAAVAATTGALALVVPFLAPALSYRITDRIAELATGRGSRPFRIGLGVRSGSHYGVGIVLNRYLREKAGYELELVATAGVPENVGALVDPVQPLDLATIDSSSDEASREPGLSGLATIGRQYFFIVVPAESAVMEVRDLSGRVNAGARAEGQAPTLGERVLEYYGLLAPPAVGGVAPVTVVRPAGAGIRADFDAGHQAAVTRTQFLRADLVGDVLADGRFRIVPIRDHEALARALPGTAADFIPAGAFGPERRIPAAPVPTLSVATLLVARNDLPARVVSDILDVVYDPRFARDIQQSVSEETGRRVGDLPIHPAAAFFYGRNDQVTSERIGRVSFVLSAVAALYAVAQFVRGTRASDRRRARRKLLEAELEKLGVLRRKLSVADGATARALLIEADAILDNAEGDAAADRLDADGIASVRSLHATCWKALNLPAAPRVEPEPPAATGPPASA